MMPPQPHAAAPPPAETGAGPVRLPWRGAHDLDGMLAFFARRALPGVETVAVGIYQRVFLCHGAAGTLNVRRWPGQSALQVHVCHRHPAARAQALARVRKMFDLDADMDAVAAVLDRDRQLAGMRQRHPGTRVPGGWSGWEMAVRAVVGQQISVPAARTLLGRLVARFGASHRLGDGREIRLLPTPAALAAADPGAFGLTRQRARTLQHMAQAVATGTVGFAPEQALGTFCAAWTALPGIGPWTAQYIAMRTLPGRDALPAADLILRRVAGAGHALGARALEQRSQAWRPWRSYATVLLWRAAADAKQGTQA